MAALATKRKPAPASIAVEPRAGGRWAVQKNGTTRASKQEPGGRPGPRPGEARGVELIVKDQAGKIQSRDSHGRDRADRKD